MKDLFHPIQSKIFSVVTVIIINAGYLIQIIIGQNFGYDVPTYFFYLFLPTIILFGVILLGIAVYAHWQHSNPDKPKLKEYLLKIYFETTAAQLHSI